MAALLLGMPLAPGRRPEMDGTNSTKAMSEALDVLALANAKATGKRPKYFDDGANEHLLSMSLVLLQELAVTRERLDSIERLLDKKGVLERSEIEAFRADREEAEERAAAHRSLIARTLRSLQQEIEGMSGPDESVEDLASEFAKNDA